MSQVAEHLRKADDELRGHVTSDSGARATSATEAAITQAHAQLAIAHLLAQLVEVLEAIENRQRGR